MSFFGQFGQRYGIRWGLTAEGSWRWDVCDRKTAFRAAHTDWILALGNQLITGLRINQPYNRHPSRWLAHLILGEYPFNWPTKSMPATLKGLLQITTFNHCHFRTKKNTLKSIKSITSEYLRKYSPLILQGILVSHENHISFWHRSH